MSSENVLAHSSYADTLLSTLTDSLPGHGKPFVFAFNGWNLASEATECSGALKFGSDNQWPKTRCLKQRPCGYSVGH